jgi:hypothetical protein
MLSLLVSFTLSALNDVDISSYQADLDVRSIAADFVIIKATEGTSDVNPDCDKHYQQALSVGKQLVFIILHATTRERLPFLKRISLSKISRGTSKLPFWFSIGKKVCAMSGGQTRGSMRSSAKLVSIL